MPGGSEVTRGSGVPRGVGGCPCPAERPPPQVCGHCPGPPRNGSIVAQFCASRAGTESEGRCCRERGARPERLLGYGGCVDGGCVDGGRGVHWGVQGVSGDTWVGGAGGRLVRGVTGRVLGDTWGAGE